MGRIKTLQERWRTRQGREWGLGRRVMDHSKSDHKHGVLEKPEAPSELRSLKEPCVLAKKMQAPAQFSTDQYRSSITTGSAVVGRMLL